MHILNTYYTSPIAHNSYSGGDAAYIWTYNTLVHLATTLRIGNILVEQFLNVKVILFTFIPFQIYALPSMLR